MTPVYSQHIDIIRSRWPDAAQALDNADFSDLNFEVVEKAAMTLKVNGVQLSSAYDPLEEAFQYRSLTSSNEYHIWGIGMGNVPSLLAQDQSARSICVYLYNLSLAKLVLSLVPQPWLSDPRVSLVAVSEDHCEIGKHLSSLCWDDCIIINADRAISRYTHQWLYFRLENRVLIGFANANYRHSDAELVTREEENAPLLKRIKSSDHYLMYQVDDAICIGAGPSLQHHIEELKVVYSQPNRPKFIAASTACKCLMENGIKPDVVFAVDMDLGDEHIPFELAINTILVFASHMPSRIFQNWHGEKYYLHLGDFTYDRFAAKLPVKYRPYSFGSVIHPLIHFTLLQGASRISLIGCDFGFPGDIIHSGRENRADDPNATMTARVENGFGEMIKTSPAYRMFGSGVENLIAASPQTKFYNWSRIGAKIIGAEYFNVEELYGNRR
ncbi:TPA: 6-hydroxymethylpterin diphosphokinase MptE-like protein [Vibrio parahaemolyticus]|nr:motility associated factor glycosyltransferase family protein [Vibrio parahaemolyticus]EII2403249.1 motility associated factor glycosyltransferase family protein [Vibrio parahaemolyticus]